MMHLKPALGVATAVLIGTLNVLGPGIADEPPVKVGDKIVLLYHTHVQVGTEKLAPVTAGTELVAEQISGDWVAITVDRNGKKVGLVD